MSSLPASRRPLVLRAVEEGLVELPYLVEMRRADGHTEVVAADLVVPRAAGGIEVSGSSASFTAQLRLGPALATPVPANPGSADPGFASPLPGSPVRREARLRVTATGPAPVQAAARVECRLGRSPQPDWLVPGLFYGENRWPDSQRRYPRFTPDGSNPSTLESDAWAFRADRAATPVVMAWDEHGGAGLLSEETSALGQSGLGLALEGGRAVLRLHFPFREEPVSYDGSEVPGPAVETAALFAPGVAVELSYWLYLLGPDRHSYAAVLRQLTEQRRAQGRRRVAWVGIEEAAALCAWGLYRWHYRPEPPVLLETAAFDREALGARGDRPAMHVSWVSGAPYAFALLRHGRRVGDAAYRDAGRAVLDHIAGNLAPGGTFWGQWRQDQGWTTGWSRQADSLHSRTLADATLFLVRALAYERAQGDDHPDWERAVRSNLEVVMASQRPDGAVGAAYAASDGRVLDWRGSAGLAWAAPLAEAAQALSMPEPAEAAARAGRYYASFVQREYLCGAPEDVDLAPTSEDGYLAVMSYMALWRADGRAPWLELARRAAEWMLTFRYTYDVSFSPHTLLGHYGFATLGADQASPSNQHLHAFGLICLPEMAELAAATGDAYFLEHARENLACFRQFVAREDGDFDAYRGMVSERYYQTTCFQAKGMLLTLSHAWSVGVLLLACEEAVASGADWEEK